MRNIKDIICQKISLKYIAKLIDLEILMLNILQRSGTVLRRIILLIYNLFVISIMKNVFTWYPTLFPIANLEVIISKLIFFKTGEDTWIYRLTAVSTYIRFLLIRRRWDAFTTDLFLILYLVYAAISVIVEILNTAIPTLTINYIFCIW